MPTNYVYTFASSLALLLPAFLILVVVYFLLKKRFSFDAHFLRALLPFAVLGALVRSLTDKGFLPYGGAPTEVGYWTHTPGLWLMGGIAVVLLLLGLRQRFKENALPIVEKTGWVLAALVGIFLLFTRFPEKTDFLLVLFLGVIAVALWLLAEKLFPMRFLSDHLNFAAFASNALDGAASIGAF
ncbi:MAG: DUF63 family protein, partial [Candidatus Diapherotrites archaeon]|nr:DUF63 family protein [Candidatus Diapherotrites archaeon]